MLVLLKEVRSALYGFIWYVEERSIERERRSERWQLRCTIRFHLSTSSSHLCF